MRFVSFKNNQQVRLGIVVNNTIYDLSSVSENAGKKLPSSMREFLFLEETGMDLARELELKIKDAKIDDSGTAYSEDLLMAPVPEPTSCRDAYAFRQHVAAARRNRKVDMIPEFDQFPIWYFTNHHAITGPGDIWCMPDHFNKLDFELEAAVVIGKRGMNIKAADADKYIAGYTIMNDMSARLMQMEEMKLNLGPAKGKDFSTTIGPVLVTPDELSKFKTSAKPGHTGDRYNLKMKCWINDVQVSDGNMGDMDWTFAEIIERCAYGTDVIPGDVIGSGTVGTGCFLELNGTGLLNDPNYKVQWLQEGDRVDMEIEGIGKLHNTIKKYDTDFSLLKLKKNLEKSAAI
ncbi:MAG: fumarylacetoacetate hydrolase family protein [Bacteroidia bacterium]|nr:fumarylacetoacetate hydrolase family protein [Bacteroidia bacterium]